MNILPDFLFVVKYFSKYFFLIFSIFIEKQAFFILQIFCFFLLSCECLIILSGIFPSVNYFFQFFSFFCDFSFFSPFSPKTTSRPASSCQFPVLSGSHRIPLCLFAPLLPFHCPSLPEKQRAFLPVFLYRSFPVNTPPPSPQTPCASAHLCPLHYSRMLSVWNSPPEKSVYTA